MADWTSNRWFNYSQNNVRKIQLDLSNIYNSSKIYKDIHLAAIFLTSLSSTVRSPSFTLKINGTPYYLTTDKNFYEGSARVVDTLKINFTLDRPIIEMELTDCDPNLAFKSDNTGKGAAIYYNYKYPYQYPKSLNVLGRNLAEPITVEIDNAGYGASAWGLVGAKSYTNRAIMMPTVENLNRNNVTIYALYYNIEPWDDIENGTTGWYSSDSVPQVIINDFYTQGSSIFGLTVNNTSIQNPTTASWSSENQQHFWIEILRNAQLIYTYNEETNRNYFVIPTNVLTQVGEYTIRVKTKKLNNILESDWDTKNINFTINQPTVDNLLQNGDYWEQAITVNCRADNYTSLEWELWQNNVKIGSTRTTTVPSILIAPETFTQKDNCSVRVRGINTYQGATAYSDWREINLRLQDIMPTVDNLSLSGSNIDLPLTFSWTSTNQQKFEYLRLKDGVIARDVKGLTETKIDSIPGEMKAGANVFRVRVAYKDRWSDWKEITIVLTETLATIGVLEPDGIQVPRDSITRVWWTSNNQSKYKLLVDTKEYTGTTGKEIFIPASTLVVGYHDLELTIWYVTPTGITKDPVVKKSRFKVVGTPFLPTITSPSTFTVNRPTWVWDSGEQEAYRLQALQGDTVVYDTDWQNGLINMHKATDYLADGNYTLRIKIKNMDEMESGWSTQQFTINCQHGTPSTLKATQLENSILLRWNGTGTFYVLRDNIVIYKTNDVTYTDYSAWGEHTYTVRLTENDIYTDSNEVYAECGIGHGVIATIDNLNDMMDVGLARENWNFGGNVQLENKQVELAGRECPVTIFGEHRNGTYTLSFIEETLFQFLNMCKRRQTFIYRDRYQKLYVTVTNPNYKLDSMGINYNVSCTEVDYREVMDYD
ncbi:MAG: hypothetical protein AB9856_20895 [Cellulosilyticaceae bacterium]